MKLLNKLALFLVLALIAGCGSGSTDDLVLSDLYNRWAVLNLDIDCANEVGEDGYCHTGTTEPDGVFLKFVDFGSRSEDSFKVSIDFSIDPDILDSEQAFYYSSYDLDEISHKVVNTENYYKIEGDSLILQYSGQRFDLDCWESQIGECPQLPSGKCAYPPIQAVTENCEAEEFVDTRTFRIVSFSPDELLLYGVDDGVNYRLVPLNMKSLPYKQTWK